MTAVYSDRFAMDRLLDRSAGFNPMCLNLYYIISELNVNVYNNGAMPQPIKRPAAMRLPLVLAL